MSVDIDKGGCDHQSFYFHPLSRFPILQGSKGNDPVIYEGDIGAFARRARAVVNDTALNQKIAASGFHNNLNSTLPSSSGQLAGTTRETP